MVFIFAKTIFSSCAQHKNIYDHKSKTVPMLPVHSQTKQNHIIKISSFAKIKNVGAASGLVFHDDHLYVISDNSSYLTKYNVTNGDTHHIELFPNASLNIPKRSKPDFESIAFQDGKILIYGSGSTLSRQKQISYNLKTGEIITLNLSDKYTRLKNLAELNDDEFNIEGMFFDEKYQYYCQRGNKSENKNCIFRLDIITEEITVFYYQLPAIDGIRTTFTDAIGVNGEMFFLASAEDTNSTYLDGDIKGTFFGSIDLQTMQLKFDKLISRKNKFEGIVLYKQNKTHFNFLLCEDRDDKILESEIFELIYYK